MRTCSSVAPTPFFGPASARSRNAALASPAEEAAIDSGAARPRTGLQRWELWEWWAERRTAAAMGAATAGGQNDVAWGMVARAAARRVMEDRIVG